jgi:hypothetical protein
MGSFVSVDSHLFAVCLAMTLLYCGRGNAFGRNAEELIAAREEKVLSACRGSTRGAADARLNGRIDAEEAIEDAPGVEI